MSVEKLWDELWIGVKGQSNSVIAGSPRNAFRCSVTCFLPEHHQGEESATHQRLKSEAKMAKSMSQQQLEAKAFT